METFRIGKHSLSSQPLHPASNFNRNRRNRAPTFRCCRRNNREPESRDRFLVLGMGYVAQFVAHSLKKDGWDVSGTCTSMKKKKELEGRGFNVCVFDAAARLDVSCLEFMKCYTHLLVSIPPVPGNMFPHGDVFRSLFMYGQLRWLCYLSSTSVYGDWGGAWVDEDCPARPASEAAKLRLMAEDGWLNLGLDLEISTHVFRLGGIYGPGRSAINTIIKQGALSNPQKTRESKRFTSRVHVVDICQAIKASICSPPSGQALSVSPQIRTYNIVDDDPAPREVVFKYAEELVEQKWPGLIKERTTSSFLGTDASSSMESTSMRGEKRVSNARMKKELGVDLLYPSYRSGLQSIVDQMEPNLDY